MNLHEPKKSRFRTLSSLDRDRVQAAIDAHADELSRITGLIAVRPGFPIRGGQLQREPAVIVYVRRKLSPMELPASGIAPRSLDQFPVDVRMADPETQLEWLRPQGDVAALAAHYDGIPGDPIDIQLEITTPILCHVGPDAGWIPLRDFISNTQSTFQAAIYDFSAPYIADAITEAIGSAGVSMTLNIDSSMKDAELEIQNSLALALKDRYVSQIITCGGAGAFPTAYHEKVIVRDSEWVWISSGNWTKNSQPEKDPIGNPDDVTGLYKANREYHLILQDKALASLLAQYLEHDRDQAAATAGLGAIAQEELPDLFVSLDELREDIGLAALASPDPIAPQWLPSEPRAITISPVLSPDNYARRIDELVRSATRSLHLQYSYITWPKREKDFFFRDLLVYIGELSQRDDFDLKVIIGSSSATEKIAILAENGWNEEKVRTQSPIHNKAIIADGERVLVSSQNWSGDGFLWNRDAGIIIDDEEIAQYFERVFDFDWLARSRAPFEASLGAIVAGPADPTPPGMVRMRWRDFYGD